MPKKKGAKARLSQTDKEVIYQTYAVTGNKADTARRCGVCDASVSAVVKEVEDRNGTELPTTKAARAEVAAKLSSRIHVDATRVLDSITDDELKAGRIAVYGDKNEPDKVTDWRYYGPSAVAKGTLFGIIMDKANVAQQFERKMLEDTQSGQLMLPDSINGQVAAIKGTLKQLSFLNLRFEEDNQDLVTNAREVMAEVESVERERPDVVSIDEFDNP